MTLKILDLFAGAGGFSLGFELVKDSYGNSVFEVHRAAEIDKFACQTLRRRYSDAKIIEGDITGSKITKRIIRECKGEISIVIGGIPCQSFSLIGPRSGLGKKIDRFKKDERDELYKHFRDITEKLRPDIIVIENVKGVLSKNDNEGVKIIDKIISDFEDLGYIFENDNGGKWQILNAADFGVPQKRERVILIGLRKTLGKHSVPVIRPTHFNSSSSDAEERISRGLKPYVTVFDAVGDLPTVKAKITSRGLSERRKEKIRRKNRKINNGRDHAEFDAVKFHKHLRITSKSGAEFLRFVRPNGYKYLDHHTARGQQLSDIELFGNMKEGETAADFIRRNHVKAKKLIKYTMISFKDKYRKQKADEPSTTVFAHLEKDGNRFIHPFHARTYTPREAARIQSFPDDVIFEGPMGKKFRQIGNAVPPLMAYNIAKHIYENIIKW